MVDPYVLLVAVLIAITVYLGGQVVKGTKVVIHKIEHVLHIHPDHPDQPGQEENSK